MLTLKELHDNTPPEVRQRSKLCVHRRVSWKQLAGHHEQVFKTSCTDGPRTITLRFHESAIGAGDHEVAMANLAWVSCDCPYWLYYCEVAVAKMKSTDILYSNGQAPIIRNPSMTPYMCKHVFRVASRLRARTHKLSPPRQQLPKRIRHRKLPKRLRASAEVPPRLAEEIIRDVLLQLLHSPATEEQLANDLFGAILPSELELVVKQLGRDRKIKQVGQDYKITPRGLKLLTGLL